MQCFRRAQICAVISLLAAGCNAHNGLEAGLTETVVQSIIPEIYRGHWSHSLANCDLDAGDPSEWLFVSEQTVGSFEHSYPVSNLALSAGGIEFTTRFGDKMLLRDLGNDQIELQQEGRATTILVRCPKEEN